MVQSVEILLDTAAEKSVLAQWSRLVEAGLPSQARHTGSTNRPHVTLAVARALAPEQESAVADAVTGSLPLALRLGGLLVFGPGPFVLCRLVIASAELLALQALVAAAIGPTSAAFGHQAPGAWTPHVTLARRLTVDQLAGAAAILSPVAEVDCEAQQVRRWDGEAKLAWTIGERGSAGIGADEDSDEIGDHHGDGAQK